MKNLNILNLIGNTPLIKIQTLSEITGCEIFGKAEFLNPCGSVKDRAAKAIILDAEKNKKIEKGGTIVEGTAGNTGISLTMISNVREYRTVIVMPETQSNEKKELLKTLGAELKLVPAVPYKDDNNYIKYSKRLAEKLNTSNPHGVLWANQFDNVANKKGHFDTTGPEIWEQTSGKIDAFICSVGSGGTISGTSQFLKSKNKKIIIGLADPYGSALTSYYQNGELKSTGNSITEGIGQGRITENLKDAIIDLSYNISDIESLPIIFDLLKKEGLYLGGSSAINLAGTIKLAKELGKGKVIVTILCDSGQRYQSKIWNPKFLNSKDLPVPSWLKS